MANNRSKAAKLYFVLSDIHVPDQDANAIDIVCQLMLDLQPDGVVLNGDILDLPEVSRHDAGSMAKMEGRRISKTFAAGNALLDKLQAAAGRRCRDWTFIEGNHENRLPRWIGSGDNGVFQGDESLDIAHRLQLQQRGIKYVAGYPQAHVRLGKLLVTHGQFCGKYPAAKHMERFQTSVLVGHTHTVQVHTSSTWEGQRVAYCQGHLANPASEAMAYAPKPNAWQQGFSLVTVEANGNFHVQLMNIVDGKLFYGGKRYGL